MAVQPTPGASWHLVAGSTGAGKTTYARQLAETLGAFVFSIDEWMNSLFWADCPRKDDLPWALDRILRCEEQAALVAGQLVGRGVPVIFDMGLTTRALRERWLPRARAANVPLSLHVLEVPAEVRWQRVQERNSLGKGTYTFHVSREMFDLIDTLWELPTPEESSQYAETVRQKG